MVSDSEQIVRIIQDYIDQAEVIVTDLRGDGKQLAVHVTAPVFKDLSRIDQHKLVYKSLEGQLDDLTTAIAIQTAVGEG